MTAYQVNYDRQHDILYLKLPAACNYYGHEGNDGVVTFYNIDTDAVCGIAIFGFASRLNHGDLASLSIPFSIDLYNPTLADLIHAKDDNVYTCSLCC